MAIAIKVTSRHYFPAARQRRAVVGGHQCYSDQITDPRLACGRIEQQSIYMAVAIKVVERRRHPTRCEGRAITASRKGKIRQIPDAAAATTGIPDE